MKARFALLLLLVVSASAQSPTQPMIVVQAASTAPTPTTTAVVTQDASAARSALQALEQMKAANADTLKKQEALLQQLDELQKAADQIRIFSHRAGG